MRVKMAPDFARTTIWLGVCGVGTFLAWLIDTIIKAN
jgi:hypothetical protein